MQKPKPLPSLEELNARFTYDPDTGDLVWLNGMAAGWLNDKGYLVVSMLNQRYFVHRLIWKIMTGEDPDPCKVVDHIDRNKVNNRWDNLRLVTMSENNKNKGRRTTKLHMPRTKANPTKPIDKKAENKTNLTALNHQPGSKMWRLQVAGLL